MVIKVHFSHFVCVSGVAFLRLTGKVDYNFQHFIVCIILQIESLQKKALAGEMVTMDLVKDLQKRLEEIESKIKHTDSSVERRPKSTHLSIKKKAANQREGSLSEEETDEFQPMGDVDFSKMTASQMRSKGVSMSMSKKELMKEIRKEKMEHRKQIR